MTTNPINIGNASANVIINSSSGSIKTGALTANGGITVTGTPSSINAAGGSLTIGGATTTLTINSSTGQLWGATAFNIVTTNFTIPSTINRDYYLFCNTSGAAYTITLPTRLTNQIIRIRNFSGQTLTITAPTTAPTTGLYPTGFTAPFTTTWTGFLNNTVQTFYCDGTNWLGF